MRIIIFFVLLANILQAKLFENRLELGLKTTAYDYTERNLQDEIIDTENSKISEINGIYWSFDYFFNDYSEKNYDVAYYLNIFGSAQYEETTLFYSTQTYYYPFAQVSIGVETKIYNNLHVGLELSGQLAFDAKMDALNETFNLGKVYSYKVAAPIKIPMYEKINFTAKLEYEYANFEKSDLI